MRGIAWRRSVESKLLRRRLVVFSRRRFYRFEDVNGVLVQDPKWIDWMGTRFANRLKTVRNPYVVRKRKYSSNRGDKWYDMGLPGQSRLADKRDFRYIMNEYYEHR